ncbi:hypothetical protein T484DRAFT_1775170 [Baffinella frigidus]|nr:hypothetical protein T484DRAFT_1775170 [Cryptophyta sp. CCMP2293]
MSEDDEDEDEDEEDEEEEEPRLKYQRLGNSEEEPRLKYQRLGNSVPDILKRESASSVAVHANFLAIGTQRLGNSVPDILKRESASSVAEHANFLAIGTQGGWIYILDLQGNEVRRFASHTAVVNDLAFDRGGDAVASCSDDGTVVVNVASCSDDGTVVINGLSSAECASFTYQRPVRSIALDPKFERKGNRHVGSIALDPKFERKGNRQFASGGLAAQLLLNEKGWFSTKDKVVHSGEGPVGAVAWEGSLIAWSNDTGVKIFDVQTNQRITFIDRPKVSSRDIR